MMTKTDILEAFAEIKTAFPEYNHVQIMFQNELPMTVKYSFMISDLPLIGLVTTPTLQYIAVSDNACSGGFKTKDEIIFLLGHEFGHTKNYGSQGPTVELECDAIGAAITSQLGYSLEPAIGFFERLPKEIADGGGTHPPVSERIKLLKNVS